MTTTTLQNPIHIEISDDESDLDATPTLSQDSRTLTLDSDDKHLQIFNELRGKLQDLMMAVKAIVAARKKGRGGTADGIDRKSVV